MAPFDMAVQSTWPCRSFSSVAVGHCGDIDMPIQRIARRLSSTRAPGGMGKVPRPVRFDNVGVAEHVPIIERYYRGFTTSRALSA